MRQDPKKRIFSWRNATIYFVLLDRFYNGNPENDHSYGRSCYEDGKIVTQEYKNSHGPGEFHGGDLKGLIEKLKEGYFTDLGVDAIWISAPYEQVHGFISANLYEGTVKGNGFPYYPYHGYWALDYTRIVPIFLSICV